MLTLWLNSCPSASCILADLGHETIFREGPTSSFSFSFFFHLGILPFLCPFLVVDIDTMFMDMPNGLVSTIISLFLANLSCLLLMLFEWHFLNIVQLLMVWFHEWCHLQYFFPLISSTKGILWHSGNLICTRQSKI